MKPYGNTAEKSSVKTYQLYLDAIKIGLSDGSVYLFTQENCGRQTIDQMKKLAKLGNGLGHFIRSENLLAKADRIQS